MDLGKWQAAAVGALFLVLAGLIYLTSEPRAAVSGPEYLVREIFTPVQSAVLRASSWTGEVLETFGSLGRLREENRRLRQEVAALEAELRAVEEVRRENERLRAIVGVRPRLPRRTVIAQVVARPADPWFATVTLDRGARDGVEAGLPVVNAEGVVGHVESVTPDSARVILLVDAQSAVGGMVAGSETPVIVEGTSDPSGRTAHVRPLVRGAELSPGDAVVTSGLSHRFPKGLPIGVIDKVEADAFGLSVEGVLRPYVDFNRLDWVAVILPEDGDAAGGELSAAGGEGGG